MKRYKGLKNFSVWIFYNQDKNVYNRNIDIF